MDDALIHWLTKDTIERACFRLRDGALLCGAPGGLIANYYSELPLRRDHPCHSGIAYFQTEPTCPVCILLRLAENCDEG